MFFQIVKQVKGNDKLVTYALLLINGMLEERRSRIQYLVNIQRSHKKNEGEDLVLLLNQFLQTTAKTTPEQRDLASHVLAMLIE